jgi:phosphopantothenoylcysteine decarboxylase / phosphopantothenate---cysteine ligase
MLNQKQILLIITGGIAAYKSAILVRELVKSGAHVKVILSRGAQEFITPLTLQALSGNPVHTELLDAQAEAGMGHIELAKWADAIIVAPASANSLAKIAHGHADDLLSTVILASNAPLLICPAMNQQMWANAMVQHNVELIKTLRPNDCYFAGPASGEQACGDVGAGRMLEPEHIVAYLPRVFSPQLLKGKHLVITAGATVEAIDPVRYISNHSSGKMGFALAQAAWELGAEVTVIAGATSVNTPEFVNIQRIQSCDELLKESLIQAERADWFIGCAAVADYKMKAVAAQKMKKQTAKHTGLILELDENPDVIAHVSKQFPQLLMIGFAAETQNLREYAKTKMKKKGLDFIVANDVSLGKAFNQDENAVILFSNTQNKQHNQAIDIPQQSKLELARTLLKTINTIKESEAL